MVHLERFVQGDAMEGSGFMQPDATRETSHQGRVLVVDDDPAVCHVTGQMLEFHGFQVLYAENGEQALALFDEYDDQVSILVADIVMPKMSGPQLAHLLRIQRPELPVLFVSGLVSYANFEGVMGGWMLKKPYSPSMLATKVRDVLATFDAKSGMAS
jgi:two-component system cell cycle sensor histidine kinase/response regulator CckA